MTVEEAYRKGQEDMRRRVERYWAEWFTSTPSGYDRVTRPDRKARPNVASTIRKNLKVWPLNG